MTTKALGTLVMDMPTFGEDAHTRNRDLLNANPFATDFQTDLAATAALTTQRVGPLTADQLALSIGRSADYVNQRLKKKFLRYKLFSLVPVIRDEGVSGRPPDILGLTALGHEYLCNSISKLRLGVDPDIIAGTYRAPPRHIQWQGKGTHRLQTVDMVIAAERSARKHDGAGVLEMIPEYRAWNGLTRPTTMHLTAAKIIKADFIIQLAAMDHIWPLMVEVDLGKEVVSPENAAKLGQSLEGKGRSYWHVLASGRFQERLGASLHFLQVLIVTTSDRRLQNIRAVLGDSGLMPLNDLTPNDVFLLSTIDRAKADFFGDHWTRVDGSTSPIIHSKA